MNRQLRTLIISGLNSGWSAQNIYSEIAYYLYQKRVYNSLEQNKLNPSDFQTQEYKQILTDVERVIKALEWDNKRILLNFDCWCGL